MAFVFHRRLAMPLWTMVFFAVALTAQQPATVSLIAALGIGLIAFGGGTVRDGGVRIAT